jgi:3-hydroxyacyl-CoA dehydrogenase
VLKERNEMLNIKTISVIGANGTMGAAVAGLLAAFGNAKVFLICRKMDAALKAVDTAANSVKADAIRDRLIPKTYEEFGDCISQSDWVFETVAENMDVKTDIYRKISLFRKQDTIVTTGTSGFSINNLSRSLDENSRPYFFGTHFFNPPYNLTLCEVIRSQETNGDIFSEMCKYLKDILFRDVIEVSDTPAFLGNRIGFHFMNKALQYAVRYKKEGGIDYIDAILGPFTGRGMMPIVTVDFVGLDVHKAVVDNIYRNSRDYDNAVFVLPDFVEKLINEGKLGKKTGEGLFKVLREENESAKTMVYDIDSGEFRPIKKYDLPFAKEMVSHLAVADYDRAFGLLKADMSKEAMICKHFLISYITYGISTAQTVALQVTDADIAMSTGFNWVGPVALMQALGGFDEVIKIAKQVDFDNNLVEQLNGMDERSKRIVASPFDYRKYLRAKL